MTEDEIETLAFRIEADVLEKLGEIVMGSQGNAAEMHRQIYEEVRRLRKALDPTP